MGLNTAGFALALDQLTDATLGINKIAIDLGTGGVTASQTITFAAAVGSGSNGTVAGNNLPLTFAIPGGDRVEAIELYNGTTNLGYISVPTVEDANNYDYVVDTLTITMT